MKKPLILPEFNNEDEERDFWDKIDISEYFELSRTSDTILRF